MHLLATLSWLVLLATFANADPEKTIDGMEIVEAEWNLALTPGGEVVNLTGTVQQVYPRLLELNPTYEADWAKHREADAEDGSIIAQRGEPIGEAVDLTLEDNSAERWFTPAAGENRAHSTIGGNSIWHRSILNCNVRAWARCYDVEKGIANIRKLKGVPKGTRGKCQQLSCSNSSAVLWCVDRNITEWSPRNFGIVADGADIIYKGCKDWEPLRRYKGQGPRCYTRGRIFGWTPEWSVQIVGVPSC
ncbi:unnamed protein product [Clonostachys rosea]|uniref:Uncharacterized protein n=1 Tax=Bionectria ochroleuca TaxID=29856 RepID=A0ABY6TNC9_BIOOC|nr:unnamed protein product [Clonostachys rosea]